MEDASVTAKALCDIKADGVQFKGPYYQMCASLKENDKKFAESAQHAMDDCVVVADEKYGFILVTYGGHKGFNDLKDRHGEVLPSLKKCKGAYNPTKAEGKGGSFFCGRCFCRPLPKKVAQAEDFRNLWNQFALVEFTFSVEEHPTDPRATSPKPASRAALEKYGRTYSFLNSSVF